MTSSYREWWVNEVTENFKILSKFLRISACLAAGIKIVYGLVHSFGNIPFPTVILYIFCSRVVERQHPYVKVGYVWIIVELMNWQAFHLLDGNSHLEHMPVFIIGATIFLICIQLTFCYSKLWSCLLILKLHYQYYLRLILKGELALPDNTPPIVWLLASVIVYQFYLTIRIDYSYNLFKVNRELRDTQKKHSVLLQLIPGALLVLNQEFCVVETNENARTWFRLTNENLRSTLATTYYAPDRKMNNLTESMCLLADLERAFTLPLNTEVTLGITAVASDNFEWRVKKIHYLEADVMVVILRNVNDLIALERSDSENALKNVLLRSVSHELRTPSYAICSHVQRVLSNEANLSSIAKEELRTVHSCAKMLLSLINDILDYSRLVAGVFNIQMAPCNPWSLLNECADVVKPQIGQKPVAFVKSLDSALPTRILTDPIRFKQIVLNLLSNAVKFTQRGQIKLSAERISTNILRVTVSDTGTGISPEQRNTLFGEFASRRDHVLNPEGCGLGLHISNILAFALGDQPLQVESTLGQGSSFSFQVSMHPVDSEYDASELDLDEDKPELNLSRYHFQQENANSWPRVLVVDDTAMVREILVALLNDMGVPCIEASSGQEAIAILKDRNVSKEQAIQLVILDISMPEMDGFETTKAIYTLAAREAMLEVPVIVGHTGYSDLETKRACLQSGMVEVLQKGGSHKELVSLVQKFTCSTK